MRKNIDNNYILINQLFIVKAIEQLIGTPVIEFDTVAFRNTAIRIMNFTFFGANLKLKKLSSLCVLCASVVKIILSTAHLGQICYNP